ncbi:hypothetical protein HQ563_15525 [bacterium]|nr:hypothetical protein [bacterium]
MNRKEAPTGAISEELSFEREVLDKDNKSRGDIDNDGDMDNVGSGGWANPRGGFCRNKLDQQFPMGISCGAGRRLAGSVIRR